jgi:hypothetical protein
MLTDKLAAAAAAAAAAKACFFFYDFYPINHISFFKSLETFIKNFIQQWPLFFFFFLPDTCLSWKPCFHVTLVQKVIDF